MSMYTSRSFPVHFSKSATSRPFRYHHIKVKVYIFLAKLVHYNVIYFLKLLCSRTFSISLHFTDVIVRDASNESF